MTNKIHLIDRTIIEISGNDAVAFLQGLVTNDISKEGLIYAAMLNNQGRFLYDFFIFKRGDKIFLDCDAKRRDEIFKKLSFYKLKADVQLQKNDEIKVIASFCEDGFIDPRNSRMPRRIYSDLAIDNQDATPYHQKRISLKIAQSEDDLTYEKSIINEFGFDEINAIDYEKGCYIGQELIARTHHLGRVRKKIFHVKIANLNALEKNHEIDCEGKKLGIILSSVFVEQELHCLALIRFGEDGVGGKKLVLAEIGNEVEIVS